MIERKGKGGEEKKEEGKGRKERGGEGRERKGIAVPHILSPPFFVPNTT